MSIAESHVFFNDLVDTREVLHCPHVTNHCQPSLRATAKQTSLFTLIDMYASGLFRRKGGYRIRPLISRPL